VNIEPGSSTAFPFNLEYRMQRISCHVGAGDWLDLGCADGGYSEGLLKSGASTVVGVDVEADRVEAAREAHPDISFFVSETGAIPFPDHSFDGVFMNEVFEHVANEEETLTDVYRALRPGGLIVVISPNRGFPFEGHRVQIGRWSSKTPTPFIPWLPKSITDRWVTARNYWPQEMRRKIEAAGFEIVDTGFIMPVLEAYPWLPESITKMFRRHITAIDQWPLLRRLGVSNLAVGRRPLQDACPPRSRHESQSPRQHCWPSSALK
jgi:ubiquinone/menaquinone biosynthesis C-methylase UbiE